MADSNDPQPIETDRVRAGATPHMTRYILAISLTAIVIIYAIFLLL